MNLKDYIESGILEAYALDALTPEEKLQVEQAIAQYPELAAEVKAIEEGLLSFAQKGAIEPPAALKEDIWNAIVRDSMHQATTEAAKPAEKGNVRVLPAEPAVRKQSWQRAAIWAAFLVSILTNFMLLSQRNKVKEEYVVMQRQMDTVRQQQAYLASVAENQAKEREMLADSTMQAVIMKSVQPGHVMASTIYWNKTKGETYLAVQKLPPAPAGKQYQMWVIQDGKPVSMGVIANEVVEKGMILKLPMQVTSGQAFAISLEQEGGNPTPTEVKILGYTS